jgi:hypothetical protein
MDSVRAIFRLRSRPCCFRALAAALGLIGSVMMVAGAVAGQPSPPQAEDLLRLVPSDVAVALTVEGLREQADALLKSPLALDFLRLPAARTWLESGKYQQFERARERIQTLLGANLTEVRDELLGDAVVLALRLPLEARADNTQARGILLLRARDLNLLKRLIRVVNTIQQDNGELTRLLERQRGGTVYHVREFAPGANRPSESYVLYADGTFAFSNSETLIQSVIDRKNFAPAVNDGPQAFSKIDPGLGDLPKVRAVGGRLPKRAVARLFIDPRQFERMLAASPQQGKPTDARVAALLTRYLAAVDYAGAALSWSNNGITVQTVEIVNPALVDPWLRHWAGDLRRPDPALARVPASALAVASGHFDGLALVDALSQLVPDEDQPRLVNLETILSGLLLGQNLRAQVLPRLGPGILAYFESPETTDQPQSGRGTEPAPLGRWPFPSVLVVSLAAYSDGSSPITPAAAVDNALRTLLAMCAMDEKRAGGRSRITTHDVAGMTVITLEPPIAFAYSIDRQRGRLVLGTSAGAVERYLQSASDPLAGERLRRLRAEALADAQTFICLDLESLSRLAGKSRTQLVQTLAARQKRPAIEVDRDLAHVQTLAGLFQSAFISSQFQADASAVHRNIGLIRDVRNGK